MKNLLATLFVMMELAIPNAWADGDEPFTPTNHNPHEEEDDPYHTGDSILAHCKSGDVCVTQGKKSSAKEEAHKWHPNPLRQTKDLENDEVP